MDDDDEEERFYDADKLEEQRVSGMVKVENEQNSKIEINAYDPLKRDP